MNNENAKEYLPLVIALADGKTIQKKCTIGGVPSWNDMINVEFGSPAMFYRIKPEPNPPFWIRIVDGRRVGLYEDVESASASVSRYGGEIIKYVPAE